MAEETDCSFEAIQTHAFAHDSTCDKPLITMYQLLQKAVEKNISETTIVKKKILSILEGQKFKRNPSELFKALLEKDTTSKPIFASRVTNESLENSKNLIEKDNGVYEDPLTFGLVSEYHLSKKVQLEAEKLLETLYDQVKPLNGTAEKNFKPIQ